MKCLVFVKFLPGGSIQPDDFFLRINAEHSWLEDTVESSIEKSGDKENYPALKVRSAMCIADYDSVEQLAIDLTIMPGAGISNVEVLPLTNELIHNISVESPEMLTR
jgi:hypothetical protein